MKKEHIILPDVIEKNLKIIFCGMAAGELSAKVGGYYANTNNKFWDVLCKLKFTKKERIKSCDYKKILKYNLGLTDLVKNQIGGDGNINVTDDDRNLLKKNILKYKTKILAFNGKKAAKKFFYKKQVDYGKIGKIGETSVWVLESTSPAAKRWWNNGKHWRQLAKKFI